MHKTKVRTPGNHSKYIKNITNVSKVRKNVTKLLNLHWREKVKSHIISHTSRKNMHKVGDAHCIKFWEWYLCRVVRGQERGVCMLTLHSFLRSVVLFVKSLTVKVTKADVPFLICGDGGYDGSGHHSIFSQWVWRRGEETPWQRPWQRKVTPLTRRRRKTKEAVWLLKQKVQFGHLNTDSEGQHLAGALLEADVREKQRKQAAAQTQIETLQKQILKERQEEEARKRRRKSAGQPEGLNIRMKITRYSCALSRRKQESATPRKDTGCRCDH